MRPRFFLGHPLALPEKKLPTTLLIVDDREDVLRALERFMGLYFEKVLVALEPATAEALMAAHQPECLLCDYWLGEAHPLATALIAGWRHRFPCLRKVALMTGTKSSSIAPCPEVDVIFHKPLSMGRVLEFFSAP
jgi:DNA-binding NtrC family response regulator